MVSFPHCKINLGLHVRSRRSDGFHNIETCFYPLSLSDILEIIPATAFEFSHSGIHVPGTQDENLCVKAYQLLQRDFGLGGVRMHLHKIIPLGAGLGGGSSDAAFTLRLLDTVFGLKISSSQMSAYASQLGSDCAFFITDVPMLGTGRGEILSPIALRLKGHYLVMVKPPVHISSADAYSKISPQQPEYSIQEILQLPLKEWRNKLNNDFEKSVFGTNPVIGRIKEKMYEHGAAYASMSGSGASVFGIFERFIDLKKEFSGWDYWSGELK